MQRTHLKLGYANPFRPAYELRLVLRINTQSHRLLGTILEVDPRATLASTRVGLWRLSRAGYIFSGCFVQLSTFLTEPRSEMWQVWCGFAKIDPYSTPSRINLAPQRRERKTTVSSSL